MDAVIAIGSVLALGGLVWGILKLEAIQKKNVRPPSRGSIDCPFCSHRIHDDIVLAGQAMSCPSCHATVKAADPDGTAAKAAAGDLMGRLVAFVVLFIALYFFFGWLMPLLP